MGSTFTPFVREGNRSHTGKSGDGIGTQAVWLQTHILNHHYTWPPERSWVEKVKERYSPAKPHEAQANLSKLPFLTHSVPGTHSPLQ